MRTKDTTVDTEFHPLLTKLLFAFNERYRKWGSELVITSGAELGTKHGFTSLHYARPCCAADTRIWDVISKQQVTINGYAQHKALLLVRDKFCQLEGIPANWFDVILEGNHIHTEFQPKRPDSF